MPLNEPNRSHWIRAIEKYQVFDYVPTYYVCSMHFRPEDIIKSGRVNRVVPGRVPSIFSIENVQSIDSQSLGTNEIDTCQELSGGKETNIRIACHDDNSSERLE